MQVDDTDGWPIAVGCMVKLWERASGKPWRAWVLEIEDDERHGPVLTVECERRGGRRHVAVGRLERVQVLRPTRFQKARREGAAAEVAYATEKLRRRRAASPRKGSSPKPRKP